MIKDLYKIGEPWSPTALVKRLIAEQFRRELKPRFGFTALDPARPSFDSKGPGERIDKSDAIQVQVIHTNAGNLGIKETIGDSDFYPNGGEQQPGCRWIGKQITSDPSIPRD
jgi:hypothetical protein